MKTKSISVLVVVLCSLMSWCSVHGATPGQSQTESLLVVLDRLELEYFQAVISGNQRWINAVDGDIKMLNVH